jgi:drug/metabolite transporter (DMT)-like permease
MKPITIAGIVLLILGVLALAYQGINYNRQETVMNVGPMRVTTETHERFPLPPILGGLALVGGVVLLVVGAKKKS